MSMMVWIDPEYRKLFPAKQIFADTALIEGEVFREGRGRVTLRFQRGDEYFFLKRHTGIGWWEIIKDILQGRMPVLGAANEWQALQRLQIMNVSTLYPIAFGRQGGNPAGRQSFIITRELVKTTSLEDYVKDWQKRDDFVRVKRQLIRQVARVARRLHRNGLNHRDFYICHLHVDTNWLSSPEGEPEIFVIDLHRAQIRPSVPERWLVKDIGSLYFSAMDAGLTRNDYFRFIREYTGADLRQTLKSERGFWRAVQARADRLYSTRP